MLSKLTGPPQMFLSWLCVPRYEVVNGETYIGYPSGWSHEELIKFRKTCLLFWMLPLSGFRLRKKISSCCCPAQRPLTHSLLTYRQGKEAWLTWKCLLLKMQNYMIGVEQQQVWVRTPHVFASTGFMNFCSYCLVKPRMLFLICKRGCKMEVNWRELLWPPGPTPVTILSLSFGPDYSEIASATMALNYCSITKMVYVPW